MPYSNFSFDKVQEILNLEIKDELGMFAQIEEIEVSAPFLEELLKENLPLALAINTEKARSELIITPVLLQFRKIEQKKISFFSGIEFNVDEQQELKGTCDYIISLSEDAIRSVPREMKEASLALGLTKWDTIRGVVVPAALSGITAAVILGVARAIGETMTVLMATGNAPVISFDMLTSMRTMTATIAIEMGEVPFGSTHYHSLFAVGIVLFAITFIVNFIADRVMKRFREKY